MRYRKPEYIRKRLVLRRGWRKFKRYALVTALVAGAFYVSGSCSCGSLGELGGIEKLVDD